MASKIIISKEYRDHPCGYRVKRVRRDNQFHGEIREYPKVKSGGRTVRIYWAARLPGEQISLPGWAFDKAMLNTFSEQGCCLTHIGVMVTTSAARRINVPEFIQESYLTTMQTFREHRIEWDFGGKGAIQWALPMIFFKRKERELDDAAKIKEMRVGRK